MKKIKIKHHERYDLAKIRFLNFSSFLLGLASSLVLYWESSYLKAATASENISKYFFVGYSVALILIFNWHRVIDKLNERRAYFISLAGKALVIAFLIWAPVNQTSAWMISLYMVFAVLTWVDLDILLEQSSKDNKTGRIRGLYLSLMNAGYFISPVLSGFLIFKLGFKVMFTASFFVMLMIIPLSIIKLDSKDKKNRQKSVKFISIVRNIKERKEIRTVYWISFLLEFFYASMIIYVPLVLIEKGFNAQSLGYVFSFMLLPFLLIQYPVGLGLDKGISFSKISAVAFFLMLFSSLGFFVIDQMSIIFWAALLFLGRFGAAAIEVIRDSYFYKCIDHKNIDLITFYRSLRPIAYITVSIIAAVVTDSFHFRAIFIIIPLVMLIGVMMSARLDFCYSSLTLVKLKEK